MPSASDWYSSCTPARTSPFWNTPTMSAPNRVPSTLPRRPTRLVPPMAAALFLRRVADLLDPPVTVVAQDPARIGTLAAELLFRRIDGDDSPPREHVGATRLIVRGSGEIPPP